MFKEIGRVKVNETRTLVISLNKDNQIVCAQSVESKEEGTSFFMKNSFIVDKDKLVDLRDEINKAIVKLKKDGIL